MKPYADIKKLSQDELEAYLNSTAWFVDKEHPSRHTCAALLRRKEGIEFMMAYIDTAFDMRKKYDRLGTDIICALLRYGSHARTGGTTFKIDNTHRAAAARLAVAAVEELKDFFEIR